MVTPPLPAALPAITIWQPWASLIAANLKRYEFRAWAPPERLHWTTIALHAGVRRPSRQDVITLQYQMQRDRGLGCCGVVLPDEALEAALDIVRQARFLPAGVFIATCMLQPAVRASALYAAPKSGPPIDAEKWAWPVFPAVPRTPVKATGKQGFFSMTVPDDWKDPPADV